MRGDGTYLPRYFSPPPRSRLAQMWAAAVIVWAGTHPAELCISFQVRKCKLYVRSSSSTWETSLKEEWVWVGFGWWGNKSYAQLTPPPSHPQLIFIFILLVLSLLSFIGSTSVLFSQYPLEGKPFQTGGFFSIHSGRGCEETDPILIPPFRVTSHRFNCFVIIIDHCWCFQHTR